MSCVQRFMVMVCLGGVQALWAQQPASTMARVGQPDPSLEVYGRPQQLVDIGGRRLNIYCLGHGSPTVILEAGLGGSTMDWRNVHAELAKTTRVCAYDRAAFGFSDPGPLPRDTRHLADDLATLIKAASLRPPYVLVGASLGGMIVRLFADTHLRDVGGMVLIDPEPAHEEKRLEAVSPGFTERINSEIEQSRACLTAVEAGVPGSGSKAAAACVASPSPNFPSTVNTHWVDISSHPPFYREFLSEQAEAIGAGSDQVEESKRSYGDLPLIVLTSTTPESKNLTPTNPDPYYAARNKVVFEMHDEIARLSSRGVNRNVPGATHHMTTSVPRVVIDAVNEVVAEARHGRSATRPQH